MHFTEKWSCWLWKNKQLMLTFYGWFCFFSPFISLPFFAVTPMLPFFQHLIYSLILLDLTNDGKGWSLRQNRNIAPCPHLKASPSHSLQRRLVSITDCCIPDWQVKLWGMYTFFFLSFFDCLCLKKQKLWFEEVLFKALVWRYWCKLMVGAYIAKQIWETRWFQQNDVCSGSRMKGIERHSDDDDDEWMNGACVSPF